MRLRCRLSRRMGQVGGRCRPVRSPMRSATRRMRPACGTRGSSRDCRGHLCGSRTLKWIDSLLRARLSTSACSASTFLIRTRGPSLQPLHGSLCTMETIGGMLYGVLTTGRLMALCALALFFRILLGAIHLSLPPRSHAFLFAVRV